MSGGMRKLYNKKRALERHPSGFYYLRIRGKRYNCGSNLKDAEKRAKEIIQDIQAGRIVINEIETTQRTYANGQPDINVWELAHKHLEWVAANLSPASLEVRQRYANYLCKFLGQGRMVSTLKREEMEAFVQHIRKNHSRSANSEDHALREIRTMFRWGEENGYCQIPPRLLPPRPSKVAKGEMKCFTVEEVSILMRGIPQDFADMITFGFLTGLRPLELRELRFSQIQTDGSGKPFIRIDHHKTSESARIPVSRTLPLCPQAMEIVERQRMRQSQYDHVFVNDAGTPYDRHAFRIRLNRWCERLKIRKLPPYALRHFFGTMHGVNGTNMDTLAKLMGHTNIQMTTRYMANILEYQRKPMEQYATTVLDMIKKAKPVEKPSENKPSEDKPT